MELGLCRLSINLAALATRQSLTTTLSKTILSSFCLFSNEMCFRLPGTIERLADYWGELCASPELASQWADQLIGITRMALSPDKDLRGHFHGTTACLSTLYTLKVKKLQRSVVGQFR